MSAHTIEGTGRLKGSDLLLCKIPLYARAKAFAESSLDDPNTEGNCLSFDGELYRVLSLLRTADVERRREDIGEADGTVYPTVSASGEEGPFIGITVPFHSSSLRRSRWGADDGGVADGLSREGGDILQRAARGRRELALVESAVTLPLPRELLRPTVGTTESRLLLGLASEQEATDAAEAERRRQKRLRRKMDSKPSATTTTTDKQYADDSDDNDSDEVDASKRTRTALGRQQQQQLSRLQRGLAVDVKRRGYGVNMMLATTAPPGEAHLVRATRVAALASDQGGAAGRSTAAAGPGARMLNVLLHRRGAVSGAETDAEDESAVKAYLKRVAWLEKQCQAAVLSSANVSSSEPSWMQMTAAQRVRKEMAHTMQERQRFSRKRTRDEDGGETMDE